MPKPGDAYYEGGYRVLIDGVPTRLAHKPSANMLRQMRERPCYHVLPSPGGEGPLVMPCRGPRDCGQKELALERYRRGR